MRLRFRLPALALAAASLATAGCSDDPTGSAVEAGSPENISRVALTFTPAGGGTALTSARIDPDGSQAAQPPAAASATLVLRKGVTYNGTIGLLNDLGGGAALDLTAEILREANFHRLFYTFTCAGVSIPVASMNRDTQSPTQPLGTTFQVVVDAGAATNGACTLNVQVHHFVEKGTGTGSTFEMDLNIDFPVSVQPQG